jgi:hypothetical protein
MARMTLLAITVAVIASMSATIFGLAMAQTPAQPPPATAQQPSPAAPPVAHPTARSRLPRPSGEQVRTARAECRAEANAKGLRGNDRAQLLRSCFAAKVPAFVRRNECRKQGKAKGLGQAGLRAFIRQCASKS